MSASIDASNVSTTADTEPCEAHTYDCQHDASRLAALAHAGYVSMAVERNPTSGPPASRPNTKNGTSTTPSPRTNTCFSPLEAAPHHVLEDGEHLLRARVVGARGEALEEAGGGADDDVAPGLDAERPPERRRRHGGVTVECQRERLERHVRFTRQRLPDDDRRQRQRQPVGDAVVERHVRIDHRGPSCSGCACTGGGTSVTAGRFGYSAAMTVVVILVLLALLIGVGGLIKGLLWLFLIGLVLLVVSVIWAGRAVSNLRRR